MRHLLIMLILLGGCSASERFDRQKWRDADLSTRERANMVGSLVKARRLAGLDRAAVVDLLGEPTPTDKWAGSEMVYILGPAPFVTGHVWMIGGRAASVCG